MSRIASTRGLHLSKGLLLLLAAALLPGLCAQQPDSAANKTAEPIAIGQLSTQTEELTRTLREIAKSLPSSSALAAVDQQIRDREQPLKSKLKDAQDLLAGSPTLMEIRETQQEWSASAKSDATIQKQLNAWVAACEQGMTTLEKEDGIWKSTLEANQSIAELEPVVERIRQSLDEIRIAKADAGERLKAVVRLQNSLSNQTEASTKLLDQVSVAAERFQGNMFSRDSYPIWQVSRRRQSGESMGMLVNRTFGRSYSTSADFLKRKQGLAVGAFLLFGIVLFGTRSLRHIASKAASADPAIARASLALSRPFSLAALLVSPIVGTILPQAPAGALVLLLFFFLVPVTRLVPLFAGRGERLVYIFASFYLLNALLNIVAMDSVLKRELIALLFASAIAILAWLIRPWKFRKTAGPKLETGTQTLIIRSALVLLIVILAANVFGFLTLSQVIRQVMLQSSYVAMMLYTIVLVGGGVFAAALHARRAQSFASVRMHRDSIEKWVQRTLVFGASLIWLLATLDLLGLKTTVMEYASIALNASLPVKSFDFSLRDLLSFVLVLTIGFLISSAIRFVLREEVLSRLRLQRGLPEVISTSLHYVLLLVFFLVAVNSAGIQLDKLTFLTGAFGVGIGFGLQNVVNNFVSGLILQFERPIHVGDVLDVSGLSGQVTRIGLRSSTVRTFQGAEVIIPNSTFISGQVVNWTLSESKRRVELLVGVAYGTDPDQVLSLLTGVAAAHSEVLADPPPKAFFKGFGASALDFELMFWADQSNHYRLRSEIAVNVNAALRDAGIEVPFPQQDLHLRSVDEALMNLNRSTDRDAVVPQPKSQAK